MSEKDQMIKLVQSMLSPDNQIRSQAERSLKDAAVNNPDKFVLINLEILKDAQLPKNIRKSSILVLKQDLTLKKDNLSLYIRLSIDILNQFKREILIQLTKIQDETILQNVSDLIAEVGSTVIIDKQNQVQENQKWTDLVQHLFELYGTGNKNSMLAALRILEGLFDQVKDKMATYKTQFIELFKAGFQNPDQKIQLATLNTLLSLIIEFKPKDTKDFKIFSEGILKLIGQLALNKDKDQLKKSIEKIFDVCQYQAGFFRKRFNDLITLMAKVREVDPEPNSNLKIEAVESLVFLIERYPELVSKEEQNMTQVVELIFKNMIEIEDNVDDDWKSPPDGFNDDLEEDDDQRVIKIGMDFIDRMIAKVGNEVMIPFLSKYINQMLQQTNWKMRHAAIMAISQIGEYLYDKLEEVGNLVTILGSNISSENPRIRYACCHALGQFADDLAPDFQDQFHEQYFKMILPRLEDNVPRVVAHTLAAMTNFLEHSTPTQIQPHFQYIYTKINFWLLNGIVFVKEACLSTLSALAEGSSELFEPVYDEVMKLIFQIFQSTSSKEFKQLKGSAIECATIIGKFWGKEKLAPYSDQLIKEMIKIQSTNIDHNQTDPQKGYLLSGWQRMCMTLGKDFLPYVNMIMPSLLEMASLPLKTKQKQRTHEAEEADIAIQVINLFMESYPNEIGVYINQIYELIVLINDSEVSPETNLAAIGCLPGLIKIAKTIPNQDYKTFAKNMFLKLWEIFVNEEDPTYKAEYCYNMQTVLKRGGDIFTEQEMAAFVQKCEEELRKSEERRATILDCLDVEEETQENIDFNVKIENNIEDDFKLEIANLFGKLFESHQEKSLSVFQHLFTSHIIPCVETNPSLINIQYAVFLMDDAIEFIGRFLNPEVLQKFYTYLVQFVSHQNIDLRQSSIFGLGILANVLGDNFAPLFDNTFKLVTQSIEMPKTEHQLISKYQVCKENGFSTLGKMMKCQWTKIDPNVKQNYVNYWLKGLPLQKDSKEALQMHDMLLQMLLSESQLILGQQNQNLQDLLRIFNSIYKKNRISNESINSNIIQVMKGFLANEAIKNQIITLNLTEDEKTFVNQFAANQ